MKVEIGTEAAQFPEKEYINEILVAVQGTSVYNSSRQRYDFLKSRRPGIYTVEYKR